MSQRIGIITDVATVTIAAGVGYTDTATFTKLGIYGKILHVDLRMNAVGTGTAATLQIYDGLAADSTIVGTEPEADLCYEYAAIPLTGSATDNSLMDNVADDGGASYHCLYGDALQIAVNQTAGAGASTYVITVRAEVYSNG